MSTLALPISQPREVSRRRLSLRTVVVAPKAAEPVRRETPAPSALESMKSTVASLPARLQAMLESRTSAPAQDALPLEVLMSGTTTLPILHNGEVYTLRKTRYGKLILTK